MGGGEARATTGTAAEADENGNSYPAVVLKTRLSTGLLTGFGIARPVKEDCPHGRPG